MKLRIAQDHVYVDRDYWTWRVWIEGSDKAMKNVEKVKWFLHPSFSPSVVVSRNRAERFRLEASGWGTFRLRAELDLLDGTKETLRTNLQLEYPEGDLEDHGREESDPPGRPAPQPAEPGKSAPAEGRDHAWGKLFLSYSSADRKGALAFRKILEESGTIVVDSEMITPGQPFELAIQALIAEAAATVVYIASNLPSAFVLAEIGVSLRLGKPTCMVSDGVVGPVAGVPDEIQLMHLNPKNHRAVAAKIAKLQTKGSFE